MKIKYYSIIIISILSIFISEPNSNPLNNTEEISLELESVSLPMVLNMIAQQYGLNLVLSGDVKGEVTLRLDKVDIKTALETILYPNGYNYYYNNDVIVVKPIEIDAIGELESRVIKLKYIAPVTVKKALETIISDKGKIIILDKKESSSIGISNKEYKANSIVITDFPTVIQKMLDIIQKIDIRKHLISIEVKIIESKIDNETKLGLSWPSAITTSMGSTSTDNLQSNNSNSTGTTNLNNFVGNMNFNTGSWTWGTLTVDQVSVVLNLLEQNGNSKLISNPHITTLENHEALIKIETVIPIPTVSRFSEGAATQDILTFYDEEVGISLVVTPRINEEGKITLDVFPKIEDIIGYTGSTEAQKPITSSRSIKTRITVADGETAALGGLLKNDLIEKENKVPLLGSIPLLGKLLFTSKTKNKTTTDLIILITPHVMD
ncbi:MAG: type II secretion system protein GspD [Candidatus Zixiibacteriota bacterium]